MEKVNLNYDYENDILFFNKSNEDYEFSEILNKSIAIDFNKNENLIGLEVSQASKQFKTKKIYLNSVKEANVKISIDEKDIKISINLFVEIHSKQTPLKNVNIIESNNLKIPNIETNMAIA